MTPSESDKTNFMCPITQKDFTLTTKVVAIKPSGYVYSNDVVEELNKKHDNWHDLVTGQPFTAKDIIVLQDPMDIKGRLIDQFDYVQKGWDRQKLKDLIKGQAT